MAAIGRESRVPPVGPEAHNGAVGADGLGSGRTAGNGRGGEKPLAQLLSEFSKEISLLVHEEVQLAKVELTDKAKRLGAGMALVAGGLVSALLGVACLLTCAIAALALVLPLWASALVIGAAFMAVAGTVGGMGLAAAHRGSPPLPTQAMESTKEDVAWLQTQLKSARR